MNWTVLHRQLAVTVAFLALISVPASAQSVAPEGGMTIEVRGLTSAMRDGLAQDLRTNGAYRIAFACVPAGILVLEPIGEQRGSDPRTTLLPLVQARTGRAAISTTNMDRSAAEARCAEARN